MSSELGAVIATEYNQGRWLVEMIGEFDLGNRHEVADAVAGVPTGTQLVVDLSAVTFLDSAVLGVLLDTHHRMQCDGVAEPFVLIVPDRSPVRRLLDLTATDDVFATRRDWPSAGLRVQL